MRSTPLLWHDIRRAQHADAPWVVLLHGLLEDHTTWETVLPVLNGSFNVVRVDLPGHGSSRSVRTGEGLAGVADEVALIIERLEIPRAHVVGFSMGARIAMFLAAQRGDLCLSLVMVDMGPGRKPNVYRHFAELFSYPAFRCSSFTADQRRVWLTEEGIPIALHGMLENSVEHDSHGMFSWRFSPEAVLNLVREISEHDFWNIFANVSCKTLVVRAGNSAYLDANDAQKMERTRRHVTLRTVAGTRHAVHREATDIFARLLLDWLTSNAYDRPSTEFMPLQ